MKLHVILKDNLVFYLSNINNFTIKLLTTLFLSSNSLLAQMQQDYPSSFKTCIPCHGLYGQKNSMHRASKPNTLSEKTIIKALKGYKDGSYDRYGKSIIMKAFAIKLNDKQREDIALYMVNAYENNKEKLAETSH